MNNIVEFGYPNLDNYFQNLLEIANYRSYDEEETLDTIKSDLGKRLDKSYFEINSKGFIVDLKRNNIALCQELEEHLKTNKKEVI